MGRFGAYGAYPHKAACSRKRLRCNKLTGQINQRFRDSHTRTVSSALPEASQRPSTVGHRPDPVRGRLRSLLTPPAAVRPPLRPTRALCCRGAARGQPAPIGTVVGHRPGHCPVALKINALTSPAAVRPPLRPTRAPCCRRCQRPASAHRDQATDQTLDCGRLPRYYGKIVFQTYVNYHRPARPPGLHLLPHWRMHRFNRQQRRQLRITGTFHF